MMFSKLNSFIALMVTGRESLLFCYSWKTGEYKLLWWKIGGRKDENGGSGSLLLKNKWECVEFVEKWVGLGCFC